MFTIRTALNTCLLNPRLLTYFPLHARPLSTTMSWMDSWSRPSKTQATPAPYYLLPGGEDTPYCHACGRVISSRRAASKSATPAKYCSSRCRAQRPGKLDAALEAAFVGFLTGRESVPRDERKVAKGKKQKGDSRVLVRCGVVEEAVFGKAGEQEGEQEGEQKGEEQEDAEHSDEMPGGSSSKDQAKAENRPGETYDEGVAGIPIHDTDDIDGDVLARMSVRSGTRIRPPQAVSQVNGSVGGEKGRAERIDETEDMLEKRREGQRKAKHKEMTKCAARRGVVFGFDVDGDGKRRFCEAVMNGKVVEPSFAKGDWAIRWRED